MNPVELANVAKAAATGFIGGILLCIPVGPINLTIINEGSRRGFLWAAMIGLGATSMEAIYCGLAFTGLASFFSQPTVKATMELVSFIFLLWLGLKFVMAKRIESTNLVEERIEEKLKPHSAFMIGFVRVMGNPGVLLTWVIGAAHAISRELVVPTWSSKSACVAGVTVGVGSWFLLLSFLVSYRRKRPSESALLKLEQISGIILLVFAFFQGAHIVYKLAQHKGKPTAHLEHSQPGSFSAPANARSGTPSK